mgnify:CR=1 FL=1|tara:strand:- start:265 stop:957 length:693 start_codon:yes stop_codon:yes gene_type:complete
MNILIDADIIAYRASFSAKDEPTWAALGKAGDLIGSVLYSCFYPEDYTLGVDTFLYLTGSNNFRYDLATIRPYKGQRGEKPKHLKDVREYLISEWGAIVVEGQEADDAIAIKATELNMDCTVVSIDKDFLQLPCTHYNNGKQEFTKVGEFEGLSFFYNQLLTGDTADNIQGVAGIGPKKAEKILDGTLTEQEMYTKCLEAYEGDLDALIENARLLWLRRKEGEMWEPPKV